jgi:hypothetical protein
MGQFYFTRERAKMHKKPGQKVVTAKLKNNKTVFKLRKK